MTFLNKLNRVHIGKTFARWQLTIAQLVIHLLLLLIWKMLLLTLSLRFWNLSPPEVNKIANLRQIQSKCSVCVTYYSGLNFINHKWIWLLESKFHFEIEYHNIPMVTLFRIRNIFHVHFHVQSWGPLVAWRIWLILCQLDEIWNATWPVTLAITWWNKQYILPPYWYLDEGWP